MTTRLTNPILLIAFAVYGFWLLAHNQLPYILPAIKELGIGNLIAKFDFSQVVAMKSVETLSHSNPEEQPLSKETLSVIAQSLNSATIRYILKVANKPYPSTELENTLLGSELEEIIPGFYKGDSSQATLSREGFVLGYFIGLTNLHPLLFHFDSDHTQDNYIIKVTQEVLEVMQTILERRSQTSERPRTS